MFQKVALIKYSHLRFDNKLTLADVDRLSKFFHQVIRKKILYVHITKISTSSAIYICDGIGRTGITRCCCCCCCSDHHHHHHHHHNHLLTEKRRTDCGECWICQLLKACADGNVEDIEDLLRNDSSLQLNTAKNAVCKTHMFTLTQSL